MHILQNRNLKIFSKIFAIKYSAEFNYENEYDFCVFPQKVYNLLRNSFKSIRNHNVDRIDCAIKAKIDSLEGPILGSTIIG